MHTFFFYFGIISFIGIVVFLSYLFWDSLSSTCYELKRKYNDYCYLSNLGWNEKEFSEFMKTTRQEMSDEDYKQWAKKNVRFWYSWICFKPKKD